MEELDRRSFLRRAAVSGLTLAAGGELVGCGAATPQARTARAVAVRRRPPSPRTIQQAIRGHVFARGTPGFSGAARVYNTEFDHVLPKWVARPINTNDVAAAVRWAVAHGVPFRARSGGHSYAGYSTLQGGLVLDLRKLSAVSVNRRTGVASIGAGAPLLNVYARLASHGATIPAGSCPSVGLGGHALGGGMGLAGRGFGLALDNIVGLEIVTADGTVRNVSRHRDANLFWALRGAGGGNFGIVTRFQFRVHPLPRSASWAIMSWPWSEASAALEAWLAWQPHATERFSSVFHLETGPTVSLTGQYLGPASDLPGLLSSLRDIPGARLSSGQEGYLALQMLWAGCAERSFASCHTVGTYPGGALTRADFRAGSDYVNRPLSAAARATLVRAIEARQNQPGSGAILFDGYGGAINRVGPNATAFVHRDSLCCLQYLTYGGDGGWVGQTRAAMRPHVSGYCYQNYIDPTLRNWQHAYYGSNYSRLKAVRRQVDPEHHFNFPQAIGR
jgi:FAD binding domain/Berberine and berberine like